MIAGLGFCLSPACADPLRDPPLEPGIARSAQHLIDEAQARSRALPGYVAISRKNDAGAIATTTVFVRRTGSGAPPLVRVERTLARGERMANAKLVLIQNHEGGWRLDGDARAIRLGQMPPLERMLPSRLGTARALRLDAPVRYTIDCGVEWFGRRCTRIRAALPPEVVGAVRERLAAAGKVGPESDAQDEAAAGQGEAATRGLADEDAVRARVKRQAIMLPIAHVYLIDEEVGVIMSWQSIGANGEVVAEVSYQEFRIEGNLPDEYFALPPGREIVEQSEEKKRKS